MSGFLLPVLFLEYWFLDGPLAIIHYFLKVNKTMIRFLSLDLLTRTFFTPIKNEYREGLVAFSVGMGIVVKTPLILIGSLILVACLVLELILVLTWSLVPILTVAVLFTKL